MTATDSVKPELVPEETGPFPRGRKEQAHIRAALLDARTVAGLLSCSRRNIYRLSDGGLMPRPIKLGRLTRWRRSEVEDWIAEGCPKPMPAA